MQTDLKTTLTFNNSHSDDDYSDDECFSRKTIHEQIKIYNHTWNRYIEVDKGIAQLLCHMWCAKIITLFSCENNVPQDYIWIQILHADNFKKFIDIVFKNVKTTSEIYKRGMTMYYDPKGVINNRWTYAISIEDYTESYDGIKRNNCDPINLCCCISVRFPKYDYQFILEQFIQYNKGYDCNDDIMYQFDNDK